jgi:hypothetical protein
MLGGEEGSGYTSGAIISRVELARDVTPLDG